MNSGETTEAWSLLSRTYMCVLQALLWGVIPPLLFRHPQNPVPREIPGPCLSTVTGAVRVTKTKDVDPKKQGKQGKQGKPVKSAVTSQLIKIATR